MYIKKQRLLTPGPTPLSIRPKTWVLGEGSELPRYRFDLNNEKRDAAAGCFDFPLKVVLAAQGVPVKFGRGVAAAQNVYAAVALKEAVNV